MIKSLYLLIFLLYAIPACTANKAFNINKIKEGDIIFQETRSQQSKALKLATKSRYTHVGIIFKKRNRLYVLEAVQPVRITGFNTFIRRGVNRHFIIKRLKKADELLTETNILKMKKYSRNFLGKNYDIYFEWSNNRIYCSELVWKIYKKVLNVELGELQTLKDFDLSHPHVKRLMRRRYGKRIPYNEKVISVSTMFESKNLETVMEYN